MRAKWVGERVRGGQVLGGKVEVYLAAGELAGSQAAAKLRRRRSNVELDLAGMSIAYIDKMPPVLTGDAKLKVIRA